MMIPQPPHDLDRAERKLFRRTAQTLAEQGVDVLARADLIGDYTRAASRVAYLREQEKTADFDQKIAAARAVNVALMEKRRLRDQLWRGVAIKRPQPSVAERVAEISRDEGEEAWRQYIWRKDRTLSERELEERYGPVSWNALLYESAREQAAAELFYEACANRRRPLNFEDFVIQDEGDERALY